MKYINISPTIEAIKYDGTNKYEVTEWAMQKHGATSVEYLYDIKNDTYLRIASDASTVYVFVNHWATKSLEFNVFNCYSDIDFKSRFMISPEIEVQKKLDKSLLENDKLQLEINELKREVSRLEDRIEYIRLY